jgi:hypothetical protein
MAFDTECPVASTTVPLIVPTAAGAVRFRLTTGADAT